LVDNAVTMARGKVLTKEVKGLIRREYINNPKYTAEEIRGQVENILGMDEEQYGHLWPIPKRWPGLSTVQHEIAKVKEEIKKQSTEEKEQEELWDMSTLGKYPIPPEVVPLVLEISMSSEEPLTIREAKWLGRLGTLLSTILVQQGKAPTVNFLRGIATYYATTERINMMMGERVAPVMDKILWEFLTKQESVDEVIKRGFNPGRDDDRWRVTESGTLSFMLTSQELNHAEKVVRKLGYPKSLKDSMRDKLGVTLEIKEGKDERTSEQRQSTKAKRHR